MADKREFLFSFLGRETVSPAAGKAERAIGDLGDQMTDTRRDAAALDKQIGDVEASLRDLATQYARTGDDKFVGQIRAQERELRKLRKVRTHLGDVFDPGDVADIGVQLGAKIGPVFVQSLGRAVGSAGPAAAIGAPLVLGLASWLGSAGVGAILGGAAAGSVAGGIALAARDSRVKAAGATLADSIGAQLEDAAAPFVPATLRAIDTVRAGFVGLDDEIGDIFGTSAGYVDPFTDALVGLAREAAPGLRDLVRGAQPVVTMLAGQLPELGAEIGGALSLLAEHGPEAARALGLLLEVVGAGIEGTARILGIAAEVYKWVDIISAGPLSPDTAAQYQIAAAAAEESTNSWSGALAGLGDTASGTTVEIRSLGDVLDEIVTGNLDVAEAQLAAEQAIVDATKAIRENGKSTNENSQTYRDNQGELLGLAERLNGLTRSYEDNGIGADVARQAYESNREALIRAAMQAGRTKEEAKRLADQWLKVPRNVTTSVTANTGTAQSKLNTIKSTLAALDGRTANASVYIHAYNKNAGPLDQRATGGPVRANEAYIVGEHRPEVFVPDTAGRIIPSVEEFIGGGGGRYAAAVAPAAADGGVLKLDITIRWPDGRVAERIVRDAFTGNARGVLSALQSAVRQNPGVNLRGR